MATVHEQLTEQFQAWERRGRGWQVFSRPVVLEPPFRPFEGHYQPDTPAVDDGRRPTILSSLFQTIVGNHNAEPPAPPQIAEEESEPQPMIRDSLVELQTSLPANLNIPKEAFEQFLSNLALCREPITFELLGVENRVAAQFALHPDDAPSVRRQLQAYFPEAVFLPCENTLENAWLTCSGEDELAVEFGLAREFMLRLASGKLDPFIGIIGALSELQAGELGLFQVLFQPAREPWADSIVWSVTHADGKPFFVNMPELADGAKNKVARPLYAAVVRIAVRTESQERTLQLARDLASSLRVFANPSGNELIPLSNEDYPFEEHVEDVLHRQSRRTGMLLNSDELIGFVHLPSSAVRSAAFRRDTGKSKAAPAIARVATGILLGNNVHAGSAVEVRLSPEQRVRHCHIIGASGTGKSTLLLNLISSDIANGQGLAMLDPHGDLIDRILGCISSERIADVILFDAADETHSIGFNILTAHSDLEKTLLASDLISVFQRLSASWGDQMASVMQNAILAFLESSRGGTLADLRRFLLDAEFRNEFLTTVTDPDLIYYWRKGFPQLGGNKSIGPVLTRLETFLTPKPVRYIVSQQANRLDFAGMMDSGKIFLAKLSQGQIGKENAFLLGSLLMSKFQQTAMSRQAQHITARRDFWLYLDECHHFITPSTAEIVSGARKYRLGLTLAHQELRQLQRDQETASAVLSNCYTRVVFRVGDDDARKLSDGFAFFEARDLQNLDIGQAICRVERSDFDFNLAVPLRAEPDESVARERRQAIIAASRQIYATPRAEVEAMLASKLQPSRPPTPPAPTQAPVVVAPISPEPVKVVAVPKLSEPPTPPVVEPKLTEVVPPVVALVSKPPVVVEKKPPGPPADLGKGGEQHKAMQQRIKEAADTLGFRSVIEKQIGESQESIDLFLERSGQQVACEISVSTTIDHEVGNVRKCLKAGVPQVAVICVSQDRLQKIAAAVTGSLGAEASARVAYYEPDQFIAYLKTLPVPVSLNAVTTHHGYKVKRSAPKLTAEERRQREETANRLMAEAMRPKR